MRERGTPGRSMGASGKDEGVSPAVLGCGRGVAGVAAGSAPPAWGAPLKGPRSPPCCSRASPFSPHHPVARRETGHRGAASAREGCPWAGPGHPGNLSQGGLGLASCPARAAITGRNRPTWKALRWRLPVLLGAHPGAVTSEGVTWHRSLGGDRGDCSQQGFCFSVRSDGPAPRPLWAQMLSGWGGGRGTGEQVT